MMRVPTCLTLIAALLVCSCISRADSTVTDATICIDPGHPSEVGSGTEGRHVTEMHEAWVIGNDVKKLLVARGMKVVMTKTSEHQFVKNRRRAEIANAASTSLMIRLHCDADAGSGFAVYYPDRQGVSQGVRGPSADVLASSKLCATVFHDVMASSLKGQLADRGLHSDMSTHVGSKQGALTGSIFSKVPVLLIEMCVLTNPKDEDWITSKTGEAAMASAIAEGAINAVNANSNHARGQVLP